MIEGLFFQTHRNHPEQIPSNIKEFALDKNKKTLPFDIYAHLPTEKESSLRKELCQMHTLEEAIRWSMKSSPPRQILEFINQDEYAIDIVFCYKKELHVVFDTT